MARLIKETAVERPRVRYDVTQQRVTVHQGRQAMVLPERYASYDEAMIAGYAYLRSQGWDPVA